MEGQKVMHRIQEEFLARLREKDAEVEIALTGKEKLIGRITDFDNISILLETSTTTHLIYLHGVCYIHEV